jgi:hypothetical protein
MWKVMACMCVQALRDETAPDPHDSAEEEEEEVEEDEGK